MTSEKPFLRGVSQELLNSVENYGVVGYNNLTKNEVLSSLFSSLDAHHGIHQYYISQVSRPH